MIIKFAFFLGCFAASAADHLIDFSSERNQNTSKPSLEVSPPSSFDPYIYQTIQNFYPESPPWLLQEAIDKQDPVSRKQSCGLIFEKVENLTRTNKQSLAATLCLVILNSQCDLIDKQSAVDSLSELSPHTQDAIIDLENFVKVNEKDVNRKEIWTYANRVLKEITQY